MSSTEVAWNPCSTKSVSAASSRRCRRAPRRDSTAGATELIAPTLRRERARDHEPLELRRALEECVDLGVAVAFLDREVTDVAVAATDLDGLLRHLHRVLARLELGHRPFGHLELTAIATLPARPPDQAARRLDLECHVRALEGDRLVLDDRPAELLALSGVVEGELEGRPGDAECLRADDGTGRLEGLHGDVGAGGLAAPGPCEPGLQLLLSAEQAVRRHPHVLQDDVPGVGRPDPHLLFLLARAEDR